MLKVRSIMETYRSAIFSFGASALMTKKCCILTKYHVSVDKKYCIYFTVVYSQSFVLPSESIWPGWLLCGPVSLGYTKLLIEISGHVTGKEMPSSPQYKGKFALSDNGVVSAIGVLDRETKANYSFEVRALDLDPFHPRYNTTVVEIQVLDANDNPPVFRNGNYLADLPEHSSVGFVALQVKWNKHICSIYADVTCVNNFCISKLRLWSWNCYNASQQLYSGFFWGGANSQSPYLSLVVQQLIPFSILWSE